MEAELLTIGKREGKAIDITDIVQGSLHTFTTHSFKELQSLLTLHAFLTGSDGSTDVNWLTANEHIDTSTAAMPSLPVLWAFKRPLKAF